jgi:2-keto-4-pentenoate hydratase
MQDLVDIVWDGAVTGTFDSSPLIGRWSVDDGEQAQLTVLSRWVEQGHSRGGWKVGLTSGAVRDSFGPAVRPFGFILKERIFESGATIDLGRMSRPGLETELCFRAARRIAGPDVDVDEVRQSLSWVAPAFEVNETRIDGPQDPGVRVADNLTQWGLVVGAPVSPLPEAAELEKVVVTLRRDGQEVETVAAAGFIDDHYLSISRLAKELAKFDLAVEEGDLVITGSMARHKNGIPAGEWVAAFDGIGEVHATFTEPAAG